MTDEEHEAIIKDLDSGLKHIIVYMRGVERSLPIAITALNPHATSTRKLLEAFSNFSSARAGLEHVLKLGLIVNRRKQ